MTVFNARISVTFFRMIKVLALLLLLYSTTHSPSHTETLDFPTNHFRYLATVQLLTSIKMHPTYLCPFRRMNKTSSDNHFWLGIRLLMGICTIWCVMPTNICIKQPFVWVSLYILTKFQDGTRLFLNLN